MGIPGVRKKVLKTGRKSKYETVIIPKLNKIKNLLADGYSEKEIAKKIGISYTTWRKWKYEKVAFSTLIENSREKPVSELEKTLYKSANGYTVPVEKAMKLKTVEYENGKKVREKEEIKYYIENIYIPPSFNSAKFLLLNWAPEKYSSNPAELEVRKKELQYKIEKEEW